MTHAEAMVYAAAFTQGGQREAYDKVSEMREFVGWIARGCVGRVHEEDAMLAEFKAFGEERRK